MTNIIPFRPRNRGPRHVADVVKDVVDDLLAQVDPEQAKILRARFGIDGGTAQTQQVTDVRARGITDELLREMRESRPRKSFRSFLDLG